MHFKSDCDFFLNLTPPPLLQDRENYPFPIPQNSSELMWEHFWNIFEDFLFDIFRSWVGDHSAIPEGAIIILTFGDILDIIRGDVLKLI